MPQRAIKRINHIPKRIRKAQNANPPINHQIEISNHRYSPSRIHAGILHCKFSRRLIRKLTKKPPLLVLLIGGHPKKKKTAQKQTPAQPRRNQRSLFCFPLFVPLSYPVTWIVYHRERSFSRNFSPEQVQRPPILNRRP